MIDSTIDLLLFIGILSNVIKGGELILVKEQREQVQKFAEKTSLFLRNLKPLESLKLFSVEKVRFLTLVLSGIFVLQFLIALYFSMDQVSKYVEGHLALLVTGLISFCLGWFMLPRFISKYGHQLSVWLYSHGKGMLFVGRFLTFYALLMLFLSLLLLLFLSSIVAFGPDTWPTNLYDLDNIARRIFSEGSLLVYFIVIVLGLLYPTWIYIGVLIVVSQFVLFQVLILYILELMLKFLRGLARRIAEYTKGAFAALLLIATCVLGIVRLYL